MEKMKHYLAFIKYLNKKYIMPVSGKDEKSVIKEVTDFYIDFFEDKKNPIEVVLKERTRDETKREI